MKANINSSSLSSTEQAILRELGVESGSHFRLIVNNLRHFIKIGYTYAEARLATSYCASYINRLVELAPKASRKQLRQQLNSARRAHESKLSEMYDRYYDDYTKKQSALKREEDRRRLHTSRLLTFKRSPNRREKYCAFGTIKMRNVTLEDTDLALHMSYITTRRRIELEAKKRKKHNEIISSLKEGGKHLTARVIVDDRDLPDDKAPLKELNRRYIPGGLAREFASHARLMSKLPPLEIIKTFPGNTYRVPKSPLEQHKTPPEEIVDGVVAELPAAPDIIPITMSVPQKRQGSTATVVTRPDQAAFSDAVRWNCYERCVITGATLRLRLEAAHIMPHSGGGVDHCSNGLLLRRDIHELFDGNMIAICPTTLTIHVMADALAADADLAVYHGRGLADTRLPINLKNLVDRWETFQRLSVNNKIA